MGSGVLTNLVNSVCTQNQATHSMASFKNCQKAVKDVNTPRCIDEEGELNISKHLKIFLRVLQGPGKAPNYRFKVRCGQWLWC